MSDIFQEVEEDVRRERYAQIWKQYGNYIIAGAAVLVAAVAGYQAWQRYDLTQRQQISDRFGQATQAAQTGNLPKAESDFAALTKDAPTGYATLAKFQLAGTYLAQGKRDPAIALLRELVASSDPIISSTARVCVGLGARRCQPETGNRDPARASDGGRQSVALCGTRGARLCGSQRRCARSGAGRIPETVARRSGAGQSAPARKAASQSF